MKNQVRKVFFNIYCLIKINPGLGVQSLNFCVLSHLYKEKFILPNFLKNFNNKLKKLKTKGKQSRLNDGRKTKKTTSYNFLSLIYSHFYLVQKSDIFLHFFEFSSRCCHIIAPCWHEAAITTANISFQWIKK